jgi:ABC-type nickel/cobalt efflux system permease component RcnA
MLMLRSIALASFILFLGSSGAGAAEPDLVSAAFASLIDWQREIVRNIGSILMLIRDGATAIALLSSAALAFLYGMLSELGSGHGKLVAAAYFAGRGARLARAFLMACQMGLIHAALAALLVGAADIGLRHIFGGTPAHSIWLRLAAFAIIGAVGIFLGVHTIRSKFSPDSPAIEEQDARLKKYAHYALIAAAGSIPKAGAILILILAFANDIAVTGLILVAAVSAGMAVTIFIFAAAGIGLRRAALTFPEENTPQMALVTTLLGILSGLSIVIVAIAFSSQFLMDRYG